MSTAPGWYPDPGGQPGLFRWWDGQYWTDAISEVLGPGLDSRIYARVLVGAITETVLAWPDSPEFPSSFALRELIEKTLSSFVNYHQHRGI